MFIKTLIPALAVLAGLLSDPSQAATLPSVPVYREIKDWIVGCDNVHSCQATGFRDDGEDGLTLHANCKAGPSGELAVSLGFGADPRQPPELSKMRLNGKPLAATAWKLTPPKKTKTAPCSKAEPRQRPTNSCAISAMRRS